jgi:hypothetical protein
MVCLPPDGQLTSMRSPKTDYVHYQLPAAYRKESRTAEAHRELQIYKELKAKNRDLTVPRPMERP